MGHGILQQRVACCCSSAASARLTLAHVHTGRRAVLDAERELEGLIDEDVFLEPAPAVPLVDHAAAPPTDVNCDIAIKPYQEEKRLIMLDKHGRDDPAAWVQRCPLHGGGDDRCIIQRAGSRVLAVLDVQYVLRLRVTQLRCAVHGRGLQATSNDFIITTPSVYQQIREYGVIVLPRIECLTSSVIVTRAAYECASALQASAVKAQLLFAVAGV